MFSPYVDHMYGWGLGGGLMMLILWVLVVLLVVWLIREFSGQGNTRTSSTALDILKERYVKGEINKEEFEQKKKDLQS